MNTRGELADCNAAHPTTPRGRETGWRQPEPERIKLGPRDSILLQTASRLPVANQDLLGFWTVNIHENGCSQRSAPLKRHMAHLRGHACCHPGSPAVGTREAIRCTVPGESALTKHVVT